MGKWKKSSPELIEHFNSTLSTFDEVEMRKMFGYPCSFVNGYLFTGLHEENWILRLEEDDREAMKTGYSARPFAPNGRAMREYVLLPKEVLADAEELDLWLNRSLGYVSSLPPKK